jgi:hypothetical protein
MSELTVGQLRGLPVNNNVVTVPTGHTINASGGVVQTIQTVDATTTAFSTGSSDVFLPYNKLNTTVTPKLNNSKFLVRFQINIGINGGSSYRAVMNINGSPVGTISADSFRASSNSTYINSGLPWDATIFPLTGEFLFQNSGSSNVYISFELFRQVGSITMYVNRAYTYDDAARGRPASWVTIQEIAQ